MANPRIVVGRREGSVAFAVRGHTGGTTFSIGIDRSDVGAHTRSALEDRLLAEARSLIREAESAKSLDWSAMGFTHSTEFDVWEKTLSTAEVARLMRG